MASNYTVTGHGDLDTIFNPVTATNHGPNAPTTGFKVGAQDLAARYAGSNNQSFDVITYNTTFYSQSKALINGSQTGDLRYIFQKIGY